MEPFIGQIMAFGFSFAPPGWAVCDGRLLQISENPALYSLLGVAYGGDGRVTFGLPDLRGRTLLGVGTAPGITPKNLGTWGGEERVNLTTNQMPVHNHTASFTPTSASLKVKVNSGDGTDNVPNPDGTSALAACMDGRSKGNNIYNSSTPNTVLNTGINPAITGTVVTQNAGGGDAHDNMQPYLTINYCIALEGLYPPRS